jgi:hypothetical protein
MAIAPQDTPSAGGPLGRPVLGAATAARSTLVSSCSAPQQVWALSEAEITEAVEVLGQLAVSVDAHLVAVLAEAKRRSLGAGEGWGPVDWARAHAPGLPTRRLVELDTVAGAADELRLSEVLEAVALGTGEDQYDSLEVGKAAQLVRFHQGVRGLAEATDLEGATAALLHEARGHDGISDKELAVGVRHAGQVIRPDRLVERDADIRRAHQSLVKSAGPVGLSRYTLLLGEEDAAIIDAAVDALAKPRPDQDTGEHDDRTPAARRADALVELVRRAVAAPEGAGPRQSKTTLVLTIGLDVLQDRCRGAGLTFGGEVLTAATVRRLACDAQVIPVVLGSKGEVLDQGQALRLFNRAQIRHLWMRDRHCTFPGCSRPAAWTDAHHLIHWADDGPSDVWNAALLCKAHHTVVHTQRYAGQVLDGPRGPHVRWDLRPGSYDTRVAAWHATGSPTPATGGDGSTRTTMTEASWPLATGTDGSLTRATGTDGPPTRATGTDGTPLRALGTEGGPDAGPPRP